MNASQSLHKTVSQSLMPSLLGEKAFGTLMKEQAFTTMVSACSRHAVVELTQYTPASVTTIVGVV